MVGAVVTSQTLYSAVNNFVESKLKQVNQDATTLRDKGVFATRQLAKRQLTWLRSMPELRAFDCLAPDLDQQVFAYLGQVGAL